MVLAVWDCSRSDTLPQLVQELGGILVHEENIDLVDEYEGLLSFLPVFRDAIQDGVKDHQHANGAELFSQLQNVVADQSV